MRKSAIESDCSNVRVAICNNLILCCSCEDPLHAPTILTGPSYHYLYLTWYNLKLEVEGAQVHCIKLTESKKIFSYSTVYSKKIVKW